MSDNLTFRCPGCEAEFEADLSLIGAESECPDCGMHFIIPIPETRENMEIGGFVLKRRLGQGGMGEVWLATQTAMNRDVAIKILSPTLIKDKSFIDRFMHEVKIAGQLSHSNIVSAFDAGHIQGLYYMVMQYCDGVELSDRLKIDKVIPEAEALKIARDIAQALKYAWNNRKVLHRDVKPSNIMLDGDGNALLMDMGISKCADEDTSMTMEGTMVGTPYYISPEQAKGRRDVDFRSDIYSLGATLYHMLTGQVPFDGDNSMEVATKQVTEKLTEPICVNPAISIPANTLVTKMMAKLPDERHASWKNVISDIDLVLAGKHPTRGPGLQEKDLSISPPPGSLKINLPGVAKKQSSKSAPQIRIGVNAGKPVGGTEAPATDYRPIAPPDSKERKSSLRIKGASSSTMPSVSEPEVMTKASASEPQRTEQLAVVTPEPAPASKTPQLAFKSTPAPAEEEHYSRKPVRKRGFVFPWMILVNVFVAIMLIAALFTVFRLTINIKNKLKVNISQKDSGDLNRAMVKLYFQAEQLADKDPLAAAKLLTGYEGEFAKQTVSRRELEAKCLLKKFTAKPEAPPATEEPKS
jgi:serine/threonine-protein kinase